MGQLILMGGLVFEHNGVVIKPGCCSEFQSWKEIFARIDKKESVWMGHDPQPWFEFKENNLALHRENLLEQNTFIYMAYSDVAVLKTKIIADLCAFFEKVKQWVHIHCSYNPTALIQAVKIFLRLEAYAIQ